MEEVPLLQKKNYYILLLSHAFALEKLELKDLSWNLN